MKKYFANNINMFMLETLNVISSYSNYNVYKFNLMFVKR